MKRFLILMLTSVMATLVSSQTIIDISFEQYPPLKAVAQTVSVEIPTGGITIGSDVSVDGGDGAYTYQWTNATGQILGTDKTLTVNQVGDYYLMVTDGHQCQVSVHFIANAGEGIEPIVTEGLTQIRLFNAKGQHVKTTTSISQCYEGLAPGVYVLCCIYNDGRETIRKVKK